MNSSRLPRAESSTLTPIEQALVKALVAACVSELREKRTALREPAPAPQEPQDDGSPDGQAGVSESITLVHSPAR